MPNLEYLDLSYCTSLQEVHDSLRYSKNLVTLKLYVCERLERFPYLNVESLEYLDLRFCSSLEKFPEFFGIMKSELEIEMHWFGIREIPSSVILCHWPHLTKLHLCCLPDLVSLPSSICQLKDLVELDVSKCSKVETLPERIGDLEKLEMLDASDTLISRPPSSIIRLNKLEYLNFAKKKSEARANFVFPQVNEGLCSLEDLILGFCNLIDGGLPEDIGSLCSLKKLDLSGNNFEHLPRSIAQLGALESLDLSLCKRLKELPCFTGMTNLDTLNLSYCNLIDGGLPEDIGSLSSLKELNLSGNNFEHLLQSIVQLGALRYLNLSNCKKLKELPEFSPQLDTICADWHNDWICTSLQHELMRYSKRVSDSLSPRVITSFLCNIPSWFNRQGIFSVILPENWYVSDNFLGFAVCYSGKLVDEITIQLIPLYDDGESLMSQKIVVSNSFYKYGLHFLLVPLAGLWDASKANGKTPNDYGSIRLVSTQEMIEFGVERNLGVRLLCKDDLQIGMRRSRDEEGSCSSSKKQKATDAALFHKPRIID